MSQRGSLAERFWKKVVKLGDDKCWSWLGATSAKGYGMIGNGGRGSGNTSAHRASFLIHHGSIPDGLHVLHKCDNPPCTNPNHLFAGTPKDNTQDMMGKQRHFTITKPDRVARGERSGTAKIKDNQVALILSEYGEGKISQRALAKKYDVNQATILRILQRKTWRHVA